jgi:hypothetical protein
MQTAASQGARCASGTCQIPSLVPAYPVSDTITFDFASNCLVGTGAAGGATGAQLEAGANPSGTATVWEFIQTDQIIPTGTSISISAQTATTEAGLSTATPTATYTLSTTISSPLYSTGANTIDYMLRNPATGSPQVSLTWLRVNVTLNSSPNQMSSPTLTSLMPTFDCAASE